MKLSLFSLSYNEQEHIRYWIENHKDFVDEIVLVDTGSKDKTVEIAREYCEVKVYKYDWKHHFADAKNFAIEKCSGDWLFSLACDTYIDNNDFQVIRKLIEDPKYYAYKMPFVHHTKGWLNQEGTVAGEANHTSLFRKRKDIFYTGRVHETIDSSLLIKKYIVNQIGVLKHHDAPCKNNPEKEKYYEHLRNIWKLENMCNDLREKSEAYERKNK